MKCHLCESSISNAKGEAVYCDPVKSYLKEFGCNGCGHEPSAYHISAYIREIESGRRECPKTQTEVRDERSAT